VVAQDRTLMPDAPADSAPSSSDDEVIFTCESCCKVLTAQASDIVREGDMLFCPCGERLDSDSDD